MSGEVYGNREFPSHKATSQSAKSGSGGGGSDAGPNAGNGSDLETSEEDVVDPKAIDSTGDGTPDDHGDVAPPPTWAAWLARIVTVGSLVCIIAYLLFLAMRPRVDAQFDIALDFDALEARGGQWVLPVEVTNASTVSMGSVNVEIESGDTLRTFALSLMGEGESGTAEVTFPARPDPDATEARVVSYVSP